jgi:predicted Rossmann-fold nucleotide-binding protein
MVGSEFWGGLLDWIKNKILAAGNVDKSDMLIFNVMDDPDEIVAHIKKTVIL